MCRWGGEEGRGRTYFSSQKIKQEGQITIRENGNGGPGGVTVAVITLFWISVEVSLSLQFRKFGDGFFSGIYKMQQENKGIAGGSEF